MLNFDLKSLWGAIHIMWMKNLFIFFVFIIMKFEKSATQTFANLDCQHCIKFKWVLQNPNSGTTWKIVAQILNQLWLFLLFLGVWCRQGIVINNKNRLACYLYFSPYFNSIDIQNCITVYLSILSHSQLLNVNMFLKTYWYLNLSEKYSIWREIS